MRWTAVVTMSLALGALFTGCSAGAPTRGPASSPDPTSNPARSVNASPSAEADTTESATAGPLATPSLDGSFAVADGRHLGLACWGEGSPTIMLVGGAPSDGIADFAGTPFLSRLAEHTRTCAYARAGVAGSDPGPAEPRDADDLDKDLAELLASAGIDDPVVLVGSSFGGMIAAYYAERHPEDVAGVVLLDVPAPDATLPLDEQLAWDHPDNPEHILAFSDFEHRFARDRPVIEAPLVVVTATDGASDLEDQRFWLEGNSKGTQVELPGGHEINDDDPVGSAAEVIKLVDAVR
jgi:predicted alpha/beta hydrolase family esterase